MLRLLQIHLRLKNLNLFNFTHASMLNSPPGFYNCPPGRRELPIPPEQHFLKKFFPEQKAVGEDYVVKKLPKLTRVLVTSFGKFHHLCNLYSFLCFAVQ